MLTNPKKILLALFSDQKNTRPIIEYEYLRMIVPKLTTGGFRSVLYKLEQQKYLEKSLVGKRGWCRITDEGVSHLKQHFPSLNIVDRLDSDAWFVIVFLSPPSSDPGFRKLRDLVLRQGGAQHTRGVYWFAQSLPDIVKTQLQSQYRDSVSLITANQWELVGPNTSQDSYASELDVTFSLSGISKDIERLLVIKSHEKNFENQHKNTISSVFYRLEQMLVEVLPNASCSISQVEHVLELLQKWQSLIAFSEALNEQ